MTTNTNSERLPPIVSMVPEEATVWIHEPHRGFSFMGIPPCHRATDDDLHEVLRALPIDRLLAVLEPWLVRPEFIEVTGNDRETTFCVKVTDEKARRIYGAAAHGGGYGFSLFIRAIPSTPAQQPKVDGPTVLL
jgi:hypothetical protein